METVDLKKVNRQIKMKEFGDKVKAKAVEAGQWCKDHAEIVVIGAATLGTGVSVAFKNASRRQQTKRMQDLKDLYVYDRSHGHYIKMKRKPTQSQWSKIDARKDRGESLYNILQDMRLL